ncbi:LLM class F420-dependent oxidoreductase [Paraburkholderia phymatum]|uniref:LLM class F420-dependent oxidoreductase n=1 Tax=Paraburkholderia phymatum TaxID=148447 RepID=UPI003172DDB0
MYIGINMGYIATLFTPGQEIEFAQEAERLGYRSLWVGEPYGNDAATVLAALAACTKRIQIGAGIFAIPGRTAAMTAQTAATLDWLSNGRLLMGLGPSGTQVSEGWHGVPFAKPLLRTREYVEVIRMILRRDKPLEYHGETIRLPLPGTEGKPLRLIMHPVRPAVPILLAALGPKNIELCGEIADGWLPFWFAPEHAATLRAPLEAGARAAGRDPSAIDVMVNVIVHIDDDLERARNTMRPRLALYVGGMGSKENNFYKTLVSSYGYADVAEQVQELYLSGRKAEAAALLPDELVDMVTLCGPADRIAERLHAYQAAGAHTVIPMFETSNFEERMSQLRAFVDIAKRSGCVTLNLD